LLDEEGVGMALTIAIIILIIMAGMSVFACYHVHDEKKAGVR
jgi:zinc transporter ZupT